LKKLNNKEVDPQMNIVARVVVGFDQKEAVAYHVFSQSIIDKASIPVQIMPLTIQSLATYQETHTDASNQFIYTRFLTPYLMNFDGWAIFADGDMVCLDDIANLWALRDETKAVLVAKHDYKTKAAIKYLGNKNENYPRKNWSSLILWNCGHPKNHILTPEKVSSETGAFLHRFQWLDDQEIGELPKSWNWLATEYEDNPDAKLIHYTLGTPCFADYADSDMSNFWHHAHERSQQGLND
jgi:lipopolysaccharide biosynthesis glycosyltransferase